MSIQAIAWALEQDIKPASAKLLLIAIANYANENGEAWPSKARLAKDTSMSRSYICRQLANLEERGLIRIRRRSSDGVSLSSVIVLRGVRVFVGSDAQYTTSDAHDTRGSDATVTRVVTDGSHRTIIEPSIEPIQEKKSKNPRAVLETVLSSEAAKNIMAHRKAIKRPLTERAAELMVQQFAQCRDPDAAADMMIERGWQSIKAEWVNNQEQPDEKQLSREDRLAILRG